MYLTLAIANIFCTCFLFDVNYFIFQKIGLSERRHANENLSTFYEVFPLFYLKIVRLKTSII